MPETQIPLTSRLPIRDFSGPATYVLTHSSTNRRYVGSTANAYKRISEHKSHLKAGTHRNKYLQEAYDEDPNFVLTVTPFDNKEEAIEKEQHLLDEGCVSNDLLNIATDARYPSKGRKGRKVPDCERVSQSRRATAQMENPAHKAKMLAANETPVTIDGVNYTSITEAATKLGIRRNALYTRLWRERKSIANA